MPKKWKIAIIVLFLMFFWIRLAPVVVWTIEAANRMDWYVEKGYSGCSEENAKLVFDWSWWSLRFTDVNFDCDA